MGYFFIIALILILATILEISMRVEYMRIKKKFDQALIEAKSWGKDGWKEIK